MRRNSHTLLFCIGALAIIALAACSSGTIYSHYEQVTVSGWEKNDTLSFDVSPVERNGHYREDIGLSINGAFPFMSITLIVDQTIVPSMEMHRDTLNCRLIDERGMAKGRGVNHYQYNFHLNTLQLTEGDSLHIAVHHDMKREILPGVTNVGFTLSRQPDKSK